MAQARSAHDMQAAKNLFMQYAVEARLDLNLKGVDKDFAALPGEYQAPDGLLLLSRNESLPSGCVGVRRIDKQTCEIRRLYVLPEYRRNGIGRGLMQRAIAEARRLGYERAVLDTLRTQIAARQIYRSLGFVERQVPQCYAVSDIVYMELQL